MSDPPKIRFTCPSCKRGITAPSQLAGKQAKCPGCQGVVSIPADPPVQEDGIFSQAFITTARKTANLEREEAEALWKQFCEKFPGHRELKTIRLPGLKIHGLQLKQYVFTNCDFCDTEWSWGTAITRGRFDSCQFARSQFRTLFFRGSVFRRCSFEHMTLEYAPQNAIVFSGCDFRGATIRTSHSYLTSPPDHLPKHFSRADMTGCSFKVDTEPLVKDRLPLETVRRLVRQLFTPEQLAVMEVHLQQGDPIFKVGYSTSAWPSDDSEIDGAFESEDATEYKAFQGREQEPEPRHEASESNSSVPSNIGPGERVPRTGRWKCEGCGTGSMAFMLFSSHGRPEQMQKTQTVRSFQQGDVFPNCPNCQTSNGNWTGWTLES